MVFGGKGKADRVISAESGRFAGTSPAIRKTMRANTAKNTAPEMMVRRLVHSMGYRYRLHRRDLPGTPDLVFNRLKKVIFVHGCFWHRHPDPACKIARMPKSRLHFWGPKFEANRERDARHLAALENLGWEVLVLWECGLSDYERTGTMIQEFMERRRTCAGD